MTICACTDTSSAETGSSAMISLGCSASARGDADALALAAGELVRDSDRRARAAARPGRADPAPARSTSRPLAMPCSSIGSPMIWLDALAGVQRRVRDPGRSSASGAESGAAGVGSGRPVPRRRTAPSPTSARSAAGSARHSVDFPQPDSPTRPSVSPSLMVRLTPSTARTLPTSRSMTMPDLIGKCLTRSVTSSSGVALHGATGLRSPMRPSTSRRRRFCSASSQQRSPCPAAAARRTCRTRAGSAAAKRQPVGGWSSDGG